MTGPTLRDGDYYTPDDRRLGVDKNLARIEDATAALKKDAPLNEAEKQGVRFVIRDLATLIDEEVVL